MMAVMLLMQLGCCDGRETARHEELVPEQKSVQSIFMTVMLLVCVTFVFVSVVMNIDLFRGDPEIWCLWNYQVRSLCGGASSSLVALMRTTQESTTEIIINSDEERERETCAHSFI